LLLRCRLHLRLLCWLLLLELMGGRPLLERLAVRLLGRWVRSCWLVGVPLLFSLVTVLCLRFHALARRLGRAVPTPAVPRLRRLRAAGLSRDLRRRLVGIPGCRRRARRLLAVRIGGAGA
jgi:hypothetical protein